MRASYVLRTHTLLYLTSRHKVAHRKALVQRPPALPFVSLSELLYGYPYCVFGVDSNSARELADI